MFYNFYLKQKKNLITNSLFLTRFTVRKPGANQGREFYVCPTPNNPCKTFIWADEITQAPPSNVGPAAPRSRASGSSSGENTTSGRPRARRKCAICRQEGHTRNNCPEHHPN